MYHLLLWNMPLLQRLIASIESRDSYRSLWRFLVHLCSVRYQQRRLIKVRSLPTKLIFQTMHPGGMS